MSGAEAPRYHALVAPEWDVDAWRRLARAGLCGQVAPEHIDWQQVAQPSLLPTPPLQHAPARGDAPFVPREFLELAAAVLCHRDPQRHALLYRLVWRIAAGEPGLLQRAVDPDVRRAQLWRQAVGREVHKLHAFVRFRAVPGATDRFVAWFEPEHWTLERAAPFFVRRFAAMQWALLTPYRSAVWDGARLVFAAGARREDAPADDAQDALWRTYYASIFNPARANPTAMRQEMPRKYWRNLPEARLIPALLDAAPGRVQAMLEREAKAPRRRIPTRVVPDDALPPEAQEERGADSGDTA